MPFSGTFPIILSIIVGSFVIDMFGIISCTFKFDKDFHRCENHAFVVRMFVLFQSDSNMGVDVPNSS